MERFEIIPIPVFDERGHFVEWLEPFVYCGETVPIKFYDWDGQQLPVYVSIGSELLRVS